MTMTPVPRKKQAKKRTAKKASRKNSSLPRDVLDQAEIQKLLDACGEGPTADRNRALIALLAATGMRMSEVLALTPSDLDLKKNRARVATPGSEREIFVRKEARKPVRVWLKTRDKLGVEAPQLFCSLQGDPLSASYLRRVLPELGEKAGIQKRVYADGFRHAFAAASYEAGVATRSLQIQFGHKNIAATVAYLERIGLHGGFEAFDRAMN